MKNTACLSLSGLILCLLTACSGSHDNSNQQPASAAASNTGTLSNTKALKIYNWSDYVDPKIIGEFEKKYGIKVTYNFYDSDETLESKILTGQSGYDIVGPSNSFVGRQIKAGAYQPLDKSQIPNWKYINPKLLNLLKDVDPGNQYAVPNYWGMNTIAINIEKVNAALGDTPMPDNSWDLVFNPEYTDKLKNCGISYMDSPVEMIPLALHYAGKDPNSQSKDDIDIAANIIKANRSNVLRYSSSGYIDDLARGDVCVAIGFGGDLNIAKRRRQEATGKKDIVVLVPTQGVSLWVDTLTIPQDAANLKNAYRYLNWILEPQIAARNANYVTYAPSSMPAKALMKKEYREDNSIFPSDEVLANSYLVLPAKSDTLKYELRLWQNLKAGK
ncbi:polyamine ABC transporter substrate-binding protein [Snodgrassella alvi]|jgi:putrescine transport system substrate-binding protein|uniref:Putrescine-binding periplasmic protein n=1 Tax=Snodgrassella alvi TaxID=1196083 RepID=A0A2N9XDN9_9NEIS|nr:MULTISPECIES: polyamine ABC transporter substrate-binding protein [Snodgrassella]PIT11083.1 polyamine ABC transporter substrate-binding protein [Snodgrassella communis]PIT23005.1 polyamine ABC transporter substrate-binding protein [Snodgrassella communis]PIT45345.1 polyamine ABC transporter substrate-binding protein [Snodgrassella alvi]